MKYRNKMEDVANKALTDTWVETEDGGGGEGGVELEAATSTDNFWPNVQWVPMVQRK